VRFWTISAASRGSSSFHGIAKQGSNPIRVWRFDTVSPKGVVDLHFTLSEVPDIPFEICRAVGLQPLQSSSKPALEAGADRRELPLNGDFGEVIDGDSERLSGLFKAAERLIIVEVKCESGAAHDP
jgi:hypothetical protein